MKREVIINDRPSRPMPDNVQRSRPPRCLPPLVEGLEGRTLFASYTAANAAELIAAMTMADKTGQADTVTLAAGARFSLTAVDNTTSGATGLPAVTSKGGGLTIVGNGGVIERSPAAGTPAFRLFAVAPGAALSLTNLTIQRGLAIGAGVSAQGGGVFNQGTLTLDGVTLQDNTAQGAAGYAFWFSNQPGGPAAGGGIYSAAGAVTVRGCTIRNNLAVGGRGADAFAIPRSMPGSGTSLAPASPGGNGSGGAIYVAGGTVLVTGSAITANTARGGDGGNGGAGAGTGGHGLGGGIYAAGGGSLTLRSTAVTNNAALGGAGGILSGKKHTSAAAGEGRGGGLYIATTASVLLDQDTLQHVVQNAASTEDNNIAGPYLLVS